MGLSQQPMRLKAKLAIDLEATRARGIIIVLVKSSWLVKKILRKLNPFR